MNEGNMMHRLEQAEKELHLTKHRLAVLESEQLPRRVASIEPVVQRLEAKMDGLDEQVRSGFESVREELSSQRSMLKGAAFAVAAIVGLIQLLPYLKELLK